MAIILSTTVNLMTQNRLVLRNESWSRKLPFGNNWSRLRFGLVYTVGDETTRAANIADCCLMFGVGSSFPYSPGEYACQNMVGISPAGSPVPGSWNGFTYSSTAWASWNSSGVNPQFFSRYYDPQVGQGPSWALTASSSGAVGYSPDPVCSSFVGRPKTNGIGIFEVIRGLGGGGTATVYFYYINSTQIQSFGMWLTEADLMDCINSVGTPTVQGIALTSTTGLTIGVSEATGPLDTLFISWNKLTVPINVYSCAACVHSELIQPYLGGAADSFDSYGTQNFPPYTTSGSLSGGEWYGTEGVTSWTLYGTGWTGTSMTPGNLAGTMIGSPYDQLVQYIVSDVPLTTEINAGTGWSAAATFWGTDYAPTAQFGLIGTSATAPFDLMTQYIVSGGTFAGNSVIRSGTGWDSWGTISGTNAPVGAQRGLYGTSARVPFDLMTQYIVSGGTFSGGTFLNAGTGWQFSGTVSGTSALAAPAVGLQGTSARVPFDLMTQYVVTGGTFSGGVFMSAGTGWQFSGTVSGTANCPTVQVGIQGTSAGVPFDLMTQYVLGSVTSGVTINAGTGWSGAAVIV